MQMRSRPIQPRRPILTATASATMRTISRTTRAETTDTDGDGVGDNLDAFPNDPTETLDSDGDGVGDNADAFPTDPTETSDTDGDGVGDNADDFPNDPAESTDSDGDGIGDNADAFPNDPTETADSDGDGVGDNADAFPNDPTETADSDNDGVGDNADAFPQRSDRKQPIRTVMASVTMLTNSRMTRQKPRTQTVTASETTRTPSPTIRPSTADSDNDGVGDNADAFPNDSSETADTDGDGIGDNADDFPNDPAESTDSDGDGVGDNADAFPNDPTETADSDGDGVGDNTDAFPGDPTETIDTDGDGVGDNGDVFPNDSTETADSDGDGVGDNSDAFPNDPSETSDSDGDGVGDNADAFPGDPAETTDTDGDGVGDNADAFPNDPTETIDSDGDGIGDNSDPFPDDPTNTPPGPECGPLLQEAEAGLLSGNFVVGNDAGASGGQFVEVPNGAGNDWNGTSRHYVAYCFSVPQAGTYRLKGQVQGTTTADNSFFVRVNDEPAAGYRWDTVRSASFVGDYVTQSGSNDPVEVDLPAGDHSVIVHLREDGTRLDTLELELQNPATSCGPLVQEAEDGILNGNFVTSSDGNASGGEYIEVPEGAGNDWNGTGRHFVEYCFTTSEAGTYRLKGRVLAPESNANSFFVRINNEPSGGYRWDTAKATGFIADYLNSHGGTDPVEVDLPAGEHRVILHLREDGTGLDTLELELQ